MELKTLIRAHAATDGLHDTLIPGVQLSRYSGTFHTDRSSHRRPSIAVAVQGSKRIQIGTDTFNFGGGSYFVGSLHLPMEIFVVGATKKTPYLGFVMELDLTQVSSMGVENSVGLPEQAFKGAFTDEAGPEIVGPVTRLLRLLETPQHIPVVAPLIKREILYQILSGRQGMQFRQLAELDSKIQRIARAVDWLRTNFRRPFSMQDLSRHAGMSVSGLHHQFKSYVMVTPLQYIKAMRLEEARRLMLGTGIDASTASHEVGYASPSQFNREFRRMYGVPPARGVQRRKQEIDAESRS